MQRLIAGFLGFIFLLGCHSGPPKGIIAQETMVDVLTDVHLADGYASSVPIDSVMIVRNSMYEGIYRKYNTDSAGLRQSIEYYSAQPQLYDAMYTDVQTRLQDLVNGVQAKETARMAAIRRTDSIRNIRTTDSLNRIARDSADFKLKRHLLYWVSADSASQLKPGPWSMEAAAADFLASVGLAWFPAAASNSVYYRKPAVSVPAPVPAHVNPSMPGPAYLNKPVKRPLQQLKQLDRPALKKKPQKEKTRE